MTITTLLTDLVSVVHGTTVNKVPNIYGMINRAARAVLLDVDPKETQRIVQMPQIFNDVFDYSLPPDVKGDKIVDLRLQAGRTPWEVFEQGYAEDFDAEKLVSCRNKIYTQWNTGVKTIRIEAPFLTSPVTLTDTSTITGWSATSGASTISLNTLNSPAGGGAIVFNLSAGPTTGSIQISTLTPINIVNMVNIATGFALVYLPKGSAFTSWEIRWGSSSSDYYKQTVTQTQQGTAFIDGWNLIALPWVSATVVGSPDATLLSYVQAIPTYDGTAQTGVQFANLTFALGYYFDLQYYSKFLFRDPITNVFQENVIDVTDNNKLINLDTESYNLLFNKTAFYIAQSLQGADAGYDASYWDSEYQTALMRYKAQNPSEQKLKGSTYYRLPKKSYNYYQGWYLK